MMEITKEPRIEQQSSPMKEMIQRDRESLAWRIL